MIIGIAGLGLIGGSLARAYRKNSDAFIYAADADKSVEQFAIISGAVDAVLDESGIGRCSLILIALPPAAAAAWLEENAPNISKDALVIDCCGTKRDICRVGFTLAGRYGFEFVGGHPMAGTHRWGFSNSRDNLFSGACFVIVPRVYDDINLLEKIKGLLVPAGFADVSVTTAEEHDKRIAFTSQLAHLVSNAYIKSPTAKGHKGVSAGSYQDLTRVARLNPGMWTELFLENRDNLLSELDIFISSLGEYRDAIEASDKENLCRLLYEGSRRKTEVDGD